MEKQKSFGKINLKEGNKNKVYCYMCGRKQSKGVKILKDDFMNMINYTRSL